MKRIDKHTSLNEDQIIRDLFKSNFVPEEVPDDNFNRQVMDRVMADWVAQSNYYQPLVDKQNRWWILPGVLILFAFGFFYDAGIFTGENSFEWINNLGGAFHSLYSWVEPIHLMVIGASVAIGILLAADHLLQKLSNI